MKSPFTFCTVIRDGGLSCLLLRVGGAFQIESARAESSAVSGGSGGEGRRDRSRPSSSTSTVMVTGRPTAAIISSGPSRVMVGGWLPRNPRVAGARAEGAGLGHDHRVVDDVVGPQRRVRPLRDAVGRQRPHQLLVAPIRRDAHLEDEAVAARQEVGRLPAVRRPPARSCFPRRPATSSSSRQFRFM